ncbi:hypothetical protein Neosp_014936 [[Neocosmospora] mangrovei]
MGSPLLCEVTATALNASSFVYVFDCGISFDSLVVVEQHGGSEDKAFEEPEKGVKAADTRIEGMCRYAVVRKIKRQKSHLAPK